MSFEEVLSPAELIKKNAVGRDVKELSDAEPVIPPLGNYANPKKDDMKGAAKVKDQM